VAVLLGISFQQRGFTQDTLYLNQHAVKTPLGQRMIKGIPAVAKSLDMHSRRLFQYHAPIAQNLVGCRKG
jgi:hypothetical protein